MKRRTLVQSSLTFFIVLLMSVSVFAAEFSADLISTSGGEKFSGKVYVKGNLMRMEGMQEGEKAIVIQNLDEGKVYTLQPEEKIYIEMTTAAQSDLNDPELKKTIDEMATKKVLGKEKVNGFVCEKIQYIYHDEAMGTMTVWYSEKLDYYIKIKSGFTEMEYKNIKVGKQSQSLFEIPEDYEKMGGFFSF